MALARPCHRARARVLHRNRLRGVRPVGGISRHLGWWPLRLAPGVARRRGPTCPRLRHGRRRSQRAAAREGIDARKRRGRGRLDCRRGKHAAYRRDGGGRKTACGRTVGGGRPPAAVSEQAEEGGAGEWRPRIRDSLEHRRTAWLTTRSRRPAKRTSAAGITKWICVPGWRTIRRCAAAWAFCPV